MGKQGADVHFASRVAMLSLRVVFAFALSAIAALVTERLTFHQSIAKSWVNIQAIADARSAILLADEQMTMSAVAYAQSGNAAWKQRYQAVLPQFEAAVTTAKSLVDREVAISFDKDIMSAHDSMKSLEQLVLDLVDNGERADAANVFGSPRYLSNKKILADSINALLTKADQSARSELAWAQKRAIVFVVAAVILTLVGFLWLSRRLNRALAKAESLFEKSHQDYIDQVSANHEAKLKTTRMEQLGTLTATMAHELRNPLGAVRTSTFMLDRLWQNRDERINRAFVRIGNGIERCDRLITQLLEFSHLQEPVKQPVEFDAWLEQALHDMARNLNATIELACQLGAHGKMVNMDSVQFGSAISRLLANSAEAMINRTGELETLANAPPRIKISTSTAANGLSLVIEDNGHGIAPENLHKIAEPFFTTKNFGTGLGLPTVQRIVEQHQGQLNISAPPGAGTTVKIVLPAA